jgi:superfamily I DNA and/or RNA helicase
LELDLSDSRHRDRLPPELRANLPGEGFVNLLEAQAVVRHLEALVADPSVRGVGGETVPTLGVMALYPAQALLIRRLLQSSATLAASNLDVKVDVPAAFREQECWIGLVSLTRSHTHRAVSFGEGPPALVLALTRARARLVLFGDPGTLARRSQWDSPLDHLDEAASARERHIVSQLVDYLHGRGPHPEAFHLCEGGSA